MKTVKLEAQPEKAMERLADLCILEMTYAHVLGKNLSSAIIAKHTVNRTREWQLPDERGVVHHK